jgi:hypothetical protein
MKKRIFLSMLFVLVMAVSGFSRGLLGNILSDAEKIQVEGSVVSIPEPYSGQIGTGMVLDTESGDITVYGLGPAWYWAKNNVNRPNQGDTVTATLYKLDINGKMYYILQSITLSDGKSLDFRDSSTGLPLWFKSRRGGNFDNATGIQKLKRGGNFRGRMFNQNCPCNQQ